MAMTYPQQPRQQPSPQAHPTPLTSPSPPTPPKWTRRSLWIIAVIGAFILGVAVGVPAGTAGNTDGGSAPAGETATAPTSDGAVPPAIPESSRYLPTPADFTVTVTVVEKQCFGSAGCNVTFRPELAYSGPPIDDSFIVNYELAGTQDPFLGRLTITPDGQYSYNEEHVQTRPGAELSATVTQVIAE